MESDVGRKQIFLQTYGPRTGRTPFIIYRNIRQEADKQYIEETQVELFTPNSR